MANIKVSGLGGIVNETAVAIEIAIEKVLSEIVQSEDCNHLTPEQIAELVQDGVTNFAAHISTAHYAKYVEELRKVEGE